MVELPDLEIRGLEGVVLDCRHPEKRILDYLLVEGPYSEMFVLGAPAQLLNDLHLLKPLKLLVLPLGLPLGFLL